MTNSIGYEHLNSVIIFHPDGVEIAPAPSPLLPVLQASSTCGSDQNGSNQPRQQTENLTVTTR
jgi:hypothetical protein